MPIRIAKLEDLDRIIGIGRDCYPNRDVEQARGYLEWVLGRDDRIFLVGVDTAGIASVNDIYGFERKARLDILAGRRTPLAPLGAFRMVKIMADWAKFKGATAFRLDADTGVDFGPFATRLGGHLVTSPRYDIPLKESKNG